MKKNEIILALSSILLASVITTFLTDKQTPLAFAAWTLFFAVIMLPFVFLKSSNLKCYLIKK